MYQLKIPEPAPIQWSKILGNPYGDKTYRFEVNQPASTVIDKLRAETALSFSQRLGFTKGRTFVGKIEGGDFEISTFKRGRRNSAYPTAKGSIKPISEKKCAVEFRFTSGYGIIIALGFVAISIFYSTIIMRKSATHPMSSLFAVGFMAVYFVILMVVGPLMGRGQQKVILAWFNSLPEAQYQDTPRLIE